MDLRNEINRDNLWTEVYNTGERVIRPLDVPNYLPNNLNIFNAPLGHYLDDSKMLFLLADRFRKSNKESFIRLPLDHHLEYRVFGGHVRADFDIGSRLKSNYLPTLNSVEEGLNHVAYLALLEAISIAKVSGYKVLVNITGIYTIMSGLKGVSFLSRCNRGDFKEIRKEIKRYLIKYLRELISLNVDLIFIGDPLVNPEITGWDVYEECYQTYITFIKEICIELSKWNSCVCLHPALGFTIQEKEEFSMQPTNQKVISLLDNLSMFKNQLISVDLLGYINILEES